MRGDDAAVRPRLIAAVAAVAALANGAAPSRSSVAEQQILFFHQALCPSCVPHEGVRTLEVTGRVGGRVWPLAQLVPPPSRDDLRTTAVAGATVAVSRGGARIAFIGYARCGGAIGCAANSPATYPPHLMVEDLRTGRVADLSSVLPETSVVLGEVDSWSPDGQWLRVWGYDYSACTGPHGGIPVAGGPLKPASVAGASPGCASGLWDVAADGSTLHQTVWEDYRGLPVAFSADGRSFTFALNNDVYAAPIADDVPQLGRARRIVRIRRSGARITNIAWAQNGQLALLVNYPLDANGAFSVYIAAPHGRPVLAEQEPIADAADLEWSPDGRSLLTTGAPEPRFLSTHLFGEKLAQPKFLHLIRLERNRVGGWTAKALHIGGENTHPVWINSVAGRTVL
jgi:dipeptidyl aminopeptidase/acylaminoacyl peptidase